MTGPPHDGRLLCYSKTQTLVSSWMSCTAPALLPSLIMAPKETVPTWRTWVPTPDDGLTTDTSETQLTTERELLAAGQEAQPVLRRDQHTQFLARNLLQGFPSRYQAYDASQPWLVYWTIQSFSILQVGLDDTNRQKYARTRPDQASPYPFTDLSTRSCSGSILKEVSEEVQDNMRICWLTTHPCAHWLS
jgi:hypothetical protein